ncbi:ABC transporter permease [Actinorhabdospora filicis]|uniref:ABC transporter permease n=1 Tax=Actinorhabdospora filicis TaxID=1785913 RepID=A0A9W6W9C3_9ACTN|nr:ABC transporter ATP-binding protein [Actinorhabdospora filicis]GLZ78454.1 ABC transporter permease [Actinorhabdospora filicis]
MSNWLSAARLVIGVAIRSDPRRAILVMVLIPFFNIVAAGQALGLRQMVDGAVAHDLGAALTGGLVLIAVTVFVFQASAVATDLRRFLQQKVGLEFDRRLMDLCSGPAHIDHYHDPGFLDDAELVRQRRTEFGGAFAALVENCGMLARFLTAVLVIALVNPLLALLPLCILPLALATRRQASLIAAAEKAGAGADRERKALLDLATDPSAAPEVRLYRLGEVIAHRHREAFASSARGRDAAHARGTWAVTGGWLLFCAALIGGLSLVTWSVVAHRASAGEAVLVLLLGTRLVGATTGLSWLIGWLRRSLDTVVLYRRLAARATGRPSGTDRELPEHGDVVFDRVVFRYPGEGSQALGPIDLRLPAGSTVAVVGDNGAGKSTLVALLAGLYAPSEGRITVGGKDLAELAPEVWRAASTAVFQDYCRFELLAAESVGVGRLSAIEDRDAIGAAVASAGAADMVASLPEGLDTRLGGTYPDGTDLSSGQWQKLALARGRMPLAPGLIMLDEPTASLDPDSEAEVLRALMRTRANGGPAPITVVVSHRLTSVRAADIIVVLHEGGLVEHGSHAELMALGGRYARMYTLHAASYT